MSKQGLRFYYLEMMICLSSHLAKMGHTEDLVMLAQWPKAGQPSLHAATDANVDFIKYKGSRGLIAKLATWMARLIRDSSRLSRSFGLTQKADLYWC